MNLGVSIRAEDLNSMSVTGDDRSPFGSPQAIRDGVIEASINHEKGYVQSKEMIDIYSTREPQLAFHQRISFCLDIHNMSVKVRRPWLLMGLLPVPCDPPPRP